MNYVIKTFPQNQFYFRMYHNTQKKSWQKIKQETGCYGLINTAYFNMSTFAVESNTMVAQKWLYGPDYHEYGICVSKDGKLTVGTEKDAVYDYTVGVPPCYINGKKYASYREYGKNGATFLGVSANGDVTCLMASKDSGKTTAQCCTALLNAGCKDIFRFDGSWSTQGSLGPSLDLDPSQERKVALYLLIFKNETDFEIPKKSEITSEIKEHLNSMYGFGLPDNEVWDSACKKAMIKAVQTQINQLYGGKLTVDGSWGPASKKACPNVKSVTKNELAWLIQACLNLKGYTVDLDGSYGPGCAAVMKQFQKANGLSQDGVCGAATMTKLLG